jgi:hypothetical protein
VWIAAFIEAKALIDVAGQPNADAFANRPRFLRACGQPKRTRITQVHSVLLDVDLHSLGQSARASAHLNQACPALGADHQLDPVKWLDGPQQDSATNPGHLARHVQQERRPVDKIHISVPARERASYCVSFSHGTRGQLGLRLGRLPFRRCDRLACRSWCHGPEPCQSNNVPTRQCPLEAPPGADDAAGDWNSLDVRVSIWTFTADCLRFGSRGGELEDFTPHVTTVRRS